MLGRIGNLGFVFMFSVISKVYTITTLTFVIIFKIKKYTHTRLFATHLVPVPGICVSKPLDVVKDQPREGNDHQDDEGDRDKYDRSAAHVFLQVPRPDGDGHHHGDVPLQQADDLLPFRLGNHYCHDVFDTCCERGKEGPIRVAG